MSNSIIKVNEFSYKYPDTDYLALKNISFEINEGDFVGVLGANKAGKSTLCKSLVGITPFVAGGNWDGEIVIDDKNLNDTNGLGATEVIGIAFQDAESQFTQATVEDEIAFAMSNFGYNRNTMRERVIFASRECGIYDLLDRSPYDLSGGQQQRLAVASILALQPRVIILDETTSQLDPIGRDQIFTLVQGLNKSRNITVIMVDHNIEKIAEFANKTMVLSKGELVLFDKSENVFRNIELLKNNDVRVPQVTEASINLFGNSSEAPITLEKAIPYFETKLKRRYND